MSIYYREKLTDASDRMWVQYVCGSIISGTMLGFDASFIPGECRLFFGMFTSSRKVSDMNTIFPNYDLAMSWAVNDIFAATAHFMLPMVLMDAEDNLDFVKDATCVLFICPAGHSASDSTRARSSPRSRAGRSSAGGKGRKSPAGAKKPTSQTSNVLAGPGRSFPA